MSPVECESVEIEESTCEEEGEVQTANPLAVRGAQVGPGDRVACRVAEVLNVQLARGSMPA